MSIQTLTRLADARPNFSFEKFQMPDTNFRAKVIDRIHSSVAVKTIPIKAKIDFVQPPTMTPPRFGQGTTTTLIVLGTAALIIVGAIYLVQTT